MEGRQGKRKVEEASEPESQRKVLRSSHPGSSMQPCSYLEVDGKPCFHSIAYPKGSSPPTETPLPTFTGPFAKDYPFELDPFQQTSIACLEQGDSVMVAAHTSAGKTVVAQYACAMALRDRTRMIYTSPLKALSNQKYRELYDDFQDVGLLTGDITIHEDASCLVVTTEVFRAMLYENNSLIQEVKSVVFDEVHYLRDKERGVVWEECLILMPKQIQAIFLSATVPNAMEFATWFATTHDAPCHIVTTEYRPVPLQHYIFPAGADGMYMAEDEKGRFLEENFQQACSEITGESITAQLKKTKDSKYSLDASSDIFKLMKMVLQRGYDPVIVFAFSKRTCELLALQLAVMDINDDEEKKLVEQILRNAIDGLSDHDRRLPQVQHILPMLKRGIGVHHSGLLPIVKEIIELLFQEGLIKILFATETFSTGLNMPAKTVVFAGAKKFDDGGFRWLYPGEYIQMSGRAGRRGIDDKGIVIMIADRGMDATTTREILKGSPLPLLSAFSISYRMILDNLKMEGGDPEGIIRRSYKQYLCQAAAPKVRAQLEEISQRLEALKEDSTDQQITQYVENLQERNQLWKQIQQKCTEAKYCLSFLNPGRLVSLTPPSTDEDAASTHEALLQQGGGIWGLIVNFKKTDDSEGLTFVVDILVNSKKSGDGYTWLPVGDESGTSRVIGFSLNQIDSFSAIRVHLPKSLKSLPSKAAAMKCLQEAIRRLTREHGKVPLLDPIQDMKITGSRLKKTLKKLKSVEETLARIPIHEMTDMRERLSQYLLKQELLSEKKGLESELAAAEDMILKQELRHMLRLLVKLQYIDETGLVLKKGKISLQFRTADELILTEMVFNGQLTALNPAQITAIVSCVVQPEGTPKATKLSEELKEVYQLLEKTAQEIGKLSVDCKALKQAQAYTQRFKPDFMQAIYAWSSGASFGEVIKLSDIYEGSVVRMIRQVHRVLLELEAAVKLTGQEELQEKIQAAQELIKRDVIFAASLYL